MSIRNRSTRSWLSQLNESNDSYLWLPYIAIQQQFRDSFNASRWMRNLGAWRFLNVFKLVEFLYSLGEGLIRRALLSTIAAAGIPSYVVTKCFVVLAGFVKVEEDDPLLYSDKSTPENLRGGLAYILRGFAFVFAYLTAVIHGMGTLCYLPVLLALTFIKTIVNSLTSPVHTLERFLDLIFKEGGNISLASLMSSVSLVVGAGFGVALVLCSPVVLAPVWSFMVILGCMYWSVSTVDETISEFRQMWLFLETYHHAQFIYIKGFGDLESVFYIEDNADEKWFSDLHVDPDKIGSTVPVIMTYDELNKSEKGKSGDDGLDLDFRHGAFST